jgi:hypothetical protein
MIGKEKRKRAMGERDMGELEERRRVREGNREIQFAMDTCLTYSYHLACCLHL